MYISNGNLKVRIFAKLDDENLIMSAYMQPRSFLIQLRLLFVLRRQPIEPNMQLSSKMCICPSGHWQIRLYANGLINRLPWFDVFLCECIKWIDTKWRDSKIKSIPPIWHAVARLCRTRSEKNCIHHVYACALLSASTAVFCDCIVCCPCCGRFLVAWWAYILHKPHVSGVWLPLIAAYTFPTQPHACLQTRVDTGDRFPHWFMVFVRLVLAFVRGGGGHMCFSTIDALCVGWASLYDGMSWSWVVQIITQSHAKRHHIIIQIKNMFTSCICIIILRKIFGCVKKPESSKLVTF